MEPKLDVARLSAVYESFNEAYEEESDKSGGYGTSRVFKDKGADLIEASVGHPKWDALRQAVNRQDRGAVATLVNEMLNKSAA